jgi:cysteine synthase A
MRHDSLIDAVGHTPLLRLRPRREGRGELYAKLELQNLFAMKDRVAKQVVLDARASGVLRPGAPIVESSSGTMALGLALVGTYLGHPVHIVTDPRIDPITMAKLTALGCTVHVVESMTSQGWQSARLERLTRLLDTLEGAFWPRQYSNPGNPAAYRALAEELLRDLGEIDILVGAVGSGGSLCGTARHLRAHRPELRVVAVDCVGSVLFGQPDRPHRRQSGLGNSLHPENLDHTLIDEVHWLADDEAFAATRLLARDQKIFGGNTSGSVYLVGRHLADQAAPGNRVVCVLPDRGDRYVDPVHSAAGTDVPARPAAVRYGTTVTTWSFAVLDRPRPRFVFVESNTTGSGVLALGIAARLGFEPVLVTNRPDRYVGLAATPAVVAAGDTNDAVALRAAVAGLCAGRRVAAITTTSEFYQAEAAREAAARQLPGNSPEVIRNCRDKAATRRLLTAAGLPQPRFVRVHDAADVAAAVAAVRLPCVVKPVEGSGSEHVTLCRTAGSARGHVEEILALRRNVRGQPTLGAALVEEYVDQPEFSVETFSVDGATSVVGVTRKSVTGLPSFVEYQHVFPASLPELDETLLTQTVTDALKTVGIVHGACHTEVKLSGDTATVIEINARPGGGMIPELVRLAAGVDLLEQHLRAAAGLELRLDPARSRCAGIRFLLAPADGVLCDVTGVDAARRSAGVDRVVLTAAVGDRVRRAKHAYDRLGYVIATGETEEEVGDRLAAAAMTVTLTVREGGS